MDRFPRLILLVAALCAMARVAFGDGATPEFHDATPQLERFRDGIPHFLEKVSRGDPTTIAYFGGSITAAEGWRVQTFAKFQERWPKVEFTQIDAAIGGTGSDLGVYRLERDALRFNPDLVFVEFSVNDSGAQPIQIWRQLEGIVRQIWRHSLETDVVFVYTYCNGRERDYASNKTPRAVSASEQIAEFYGIPTLDFNIPVVAAAESGALVYRSETDVAGKLVFSRDGVHPERQGHEIYTRVVDEAFEKMRASHAESPYPSPSLRARKLERAFIADHYESAKLSPIQETQLSGAWRLLADDSPLAWTKSRLGDVVYESDEPGAKLTVRFKGRNLAIYDIIGPAGGQVRITVDGVPHANPVPLFDSFCTYWRLATLYVASDLDPTVEHVATIEIDEEEPDRSSVAFRLKDPEKELQEEKYRGRRVVFGPIMILGEVLTD